MREKVFLIIGVGAFFLFVLIFLNSTVKNRLKNNQNSNLIVPTSPQQEKNFFPPKRITPKNQNQTPTPFPTNSLPYYITPKEKKSITPGEKRLPEIISKIKTITPQESVLITNLIKKMPFENEDFSVYYLPLLNKIIFIAKNNQSLEKINQFLKENQLDEIAKKYPNLIIITNQKNFQNYLSQEEAFFKAKNSSIKLSPKTDSFSNYNNPMVPLLEILKIFVSSPQNNPTSQNITPTSNQPPALNTPPPLATQIPNQSSKVFSYSSLDNLFNEVGVKVGVPPKILKGVMTIEMPSTFNLTAEEINRYSQPGNIIPNCKPNECSATGPMQMTTGVDKFGSSTCSSCSNSIKSCPNQWSIYGSAVNIFTGETHQPNPCNLRDNLYAAAYKLKTDSGSTNPSNWSQEEVFRAGRKYYGSCSDAYRYERLGNRTYCEYLWWYYTTQ